MTHAARTRLNMASVNAATSATGVTSAVYRMVIDDVIARVKPEVVQEGLDE
jgi:hypothetical protein